MLRVLGDEIFQGLVRFIEFLFVPLRCGEQDICISGSRRIGIISDHLFVLLGGIRARQRGRCSSRASIGIKPVPCEYNTREQDDDRGHENWLFEALPEKAGFQCDIARWRWRCWHKRRVLDQFENRMRVVLCHVKVSRASRTEKAYRRDKAFWGDKMLPMNAFWNSFETLLGLG